jgi:hypothetical protein
MSKKKLKGNCRKRRMLESKLKKKLKQLRPKELRMKKTQRKKQRLIESKR